MRKLLNSSSWIFKLVCLKNSMKSAIIVVLSKKHPYGKVLYHFVPVARCSLCVLFILQEAYVQSGCCTLIRCDLLTHYIHRTIIVAINLKWMHLNYFILAPPTFNPIKEYISAILYLYKYHIHKCISYTLWIYIIVYTWINILCLYILGCVCYGEKTHASKEIHQNPMCKALPPKHHLNLMKENQNLLGHCSS